MDARSTDALDHLYPLDALRPETREQLAREAAFSDYARNEVLFRIGDSDEYTFYLLDGEVTGTQADGKTRVFSAGALQGRYAIGESQPRRFTATVTSAKARVVRFERRFLEKIIVWDQLGRSELSQDQDNRWVFRLLQSRAFQKLPSGNIEHMFRDFKEIPVQVGDTIVREGDAAEAFYVIKSGAAAVHKHLDDTESIVAYLVRGDCFGEDALLANATRNATVKMVQDGCLMQLDRGAFERVLKPPMVDWLSSEQAAVQCRDGAVLIDVRLPAEYEQQAIPGAINLPLYRLREDVVEQVAPDKKLIVYCNTGERSAAAVFILSRLKFDVSALQGGLQAVLRLGKEKS